MPRDGDGDGLRPDALNKYSYARVIEDGSDLPVYNRKQRAYELTANASALSFALEGLPETPIVNPAFVIYNWGGGDAEVRVDGKIVTSDTRQGHVITADKETLIVFIEKNAIRMTRFEFFQD